MVKALIRQTDVKRALQLLAPSASPPPDVSALAQLTLVTLISASPHMPRIDPADPLYVTYPISQILSDLISTQFADHWHRLEQSVIAHNAPLSVCQALLKHAGQLNNRNLIAWTVLYMRYIRSELGLSVAAMADLLVTSPRNFSRYENEGIELLTSALIDAETQARRTEHRQVLRGRLPGTAPVNLVGRPDLLDHIDALFKQIMPRHILLSGAVGVGKSALAEHSAQRLIARDQLEALVWVSRPQSADEARATIEAELVHEGYDLKWFTQRYPTLIVLDGIDAMIDDPALPALLHDLASAYVLLTSTYYQQIVKTHVPIPLLDETAASSLFMQIVRQHHAEDADLWAELTPIIYEQTEGNPLAIEIAASWWNFEDWGSLTQRVGGALFERLLPLISAETLFAWCVLALAPSEITSITTLTTLYAPDVTLDGCNQLLRWHLAKLRGDHHYLLNDTARAFIESAYRQHPSIVTTLEHLIVQLDALSATPAAYLIIEQCLTRGFPPLDYGLRERWAAVCWETGIKRGRWSRWRFILERIYADRASMPPTMQFAYGVCLRRSGEWDEAQRVLREILALHHADRAINARVLLELSIIARNRGEFTRALDLIKKAYGFNAHEHDAQLNDALSVNAAQTHLEMDEPQHVLDLLKQAPETTQVLALRAEALLRLEQYANSRTLANHARALIDDAPPLEAALYVTIARAFIAEAHWENAYRYLSLAITLFEQLGDEYALARAQANLALVLAHEGEVKQALALLERVEQIQMSLGDQHGLYATRHNFAKIREQFAL